MTKSKKTTQPNTPHRTMTIAALSRELNIDPKRARAKFRKHNVYANTDESKRHLPIVVSDHEPNDAEHSLSYYCDVMNLDIATVRETLTA